VCDLEDIGALSMFRLIRKTAALARMLLTLDLSCKENVLIIHLLRNNPDGHKDYCEIIGKVGELVMCDFCESCYLPECLGVKTAEELPDPYKCPKCCGKLDKFKAEWKKKRKLAKMGQKSVKDEGSDEEDEKVVQKRSRLRTQQHSDDEIQDESEGESSSESKKGGDKKSFGAHRRGGHQRVTRVCCPFFLIPICL
jgi:hypothetical protein